MKYLRIILVGLLAVQFLPAAASAHVLKIDGNIGAVLHIKPDDNPQSGTPIAYELAFQDETGQFSLAGCDCRVTVTQDSKTITSSRLNASQSTVSNNTVTFPRQGVYMITVSGKPKQPRMFEAFKLQYIVRAGGSQPTGSSFPPLLWVGIGLALSLVLLVAFALEHGTKIKGGNK